MESTQNWKQQHAQPPVQNLIRSGDPCYEESAYRYYDMISHNVLEFAIRSVVLVNTSFLKMWHKLAKPLHIQNKLECGTWYHHPRRLQCVLSRNMRIFKVAAWHYRCRHNVKYNRIWDNLQLCLLVPRSPSKHVMLTFDLQSRKV